MMNIHSGEGAKVCAELGMERIICSRDITLAQVKEMQRESRLAMEYFVHGDMCIVQSGQCYMSGILLGKSSNRGECMKPCRWSYQMVNLSRGKDLDTTREGSYLLASKDLCLLEFIPELVDSGVSSLKIEGRMRSPDFLARIVRVYRKALDDYLDDPVGYVNDITAFDDLYRNRVREFSSCFALKKPDAGVIESSGAREPFFLSTSCKEKEIDLLNPTEDLFGEERDTGENGRVNHPLLAVHVGSPDCAHEALQQGADWIYIGGEVSPPRGQKWGISALRETVALAHEKRKKVGLLTPRVTLSRQLKELEWLMQQADSLRPDALLVHNLGSLRLVRELSDIPLYADFSLNVLNRRSAQLLEDLGIGQVTLSLESSFATLKDIADKSSLPVEAIIHGPVPGMLLEHCIVSMSLMKASSHDPCRGPCRYLHSGLSDTLDQLYPVEVDQYCRSHILLSKDLACLNYMRSFTQTGVRTLRIEGQYYEKKLVGLVTALYADLIKNPMEKIDNERLQFLIGLSPRGFSLGAYPQGILEPSSSRERLSQLHSSQVIQECQLILSSSH
jgi:putative protease